MYRASATPTSRSARRCWPGGQGHVIITTRNAAWGAEAAALRVDILARAESVEFLLKRTGQSDREAAGRLADVLDNLPLALEQAAATIDRTHSTPAAYLQA